MFAFARSPLRDTNFTLPPSSNTISATRLPTGPVPANTATVDCLRSKCLLSDKTAAAAVVLQPLHPVTQRLALDQRTLYDPFGHGFGGWHMTTTDKIAVLFKASPPRVNIAPCTSGATLSTGDSALSQQLINARINCDDRIKHAWHRIGIKLQQNFSGHQTTSLPTCSIRQRWLCRSEKRRPLARRRATLVVRMHCRARIE